MSKKKLPKVTFGLTSEYLNQYLWPEQRMKSESEYPLKPFHSIPCQRLQWWVANVPLMLQSSQCQRLQGPLAPACVGEQKEALFKLYHTFRCWKERGRGREREEDRERERVKEMWSSPGSWWGHTNSHEYQNWNMRIRQNLKPKKGSNYHIVSAVIGLFEGYCCNDTINTSDKYSSKTFMSRYVCLK